MSTARHPRLLEVTARIEQRSAASRAAYLAVVQAARKPGPYRSGMGCANAAHAYAAMPVSDKLALRQERAPHLGVITAYNDMLSAHQPYENYPERIRRSARSAGATAQSKSCGTCAPRPLRPKSNYQKANSHEPRRSCSQIPVLRSLDSGRLRV
jgi:dihydroxyacid dehydratase/phosphogluconate dehydratase